MSCYIRIKKLFLIYMGIAVGVCLIPFAARAADCNCSQDTASPPFLSAGADPNLVLMIDNSASMYDLSYTSTFQFNGVDDDGDLLIDEADEVLNGSNGLDDDGDGLVDEADEISTSLDFNGIDDDGDGLVDEADEVESFCFDDTYSIATDYVGYFEKDTWYVHNPDTNRFETSVDGVCAGDAVFTNTDVCIAISKIEDGEGNPVTVVASFKATGNLLNWATASKFDVEKLILTGGKYDEVLGAMESEGRGCTGNRFIKQVTVESGGTAYKLVLGVRTDEDRDDGIDTTLIDFFPLTTDGFEPARCQEAIDLMLGDPTGFGQVKQAINDCMAYDELGPGEKDKQALTHSLHDCWYLNKQGDWPGGGAQGFNFENWCADVYTRIDPRELTADDPAYVCFGDGTDVDETAGYIGECWNPPGECDEVECDDRALEERERCNGGVIEYCTNWNSGKGECKKEDAWVVVVECDGGGAVGSWKWEEKSDDLDACIQAARERFCGFIETPQVIDPSDLQTTTGETWNIPALLMSQGAVGQVGLPLATAKGIIEKDGAPAGLLQEFSSQIRIGAMAFNHDGAGTLAEFDGLAGYIYYDRGIDGAAVIHPVGSDAETAGHTEDLVTAINDTEATSWTPLAEAMYTAIGYYTQDMSMELNPGVDFSMWDPPITEWCQSNNVLFITDGASTADLHDAITGFTEDDPDNTDAAGGFGDLFGSTFFDDLTYFGRQGDIFNPDFYGFEQTPKKINTFTVFTGQVEGGDETVPYVLMEKAVENGGPNALIEGKEDEVLLGRNPEELSEALREAFISIIKRAAAGSAASVISATRGGEGAVYQAIFWPGIDGPEYASGEKKPDATWAGEVHALLVDSYGNLYEDTNQDKTLTEADERVVFFFDETSDPVETKACYGELDENLICSGTVKSLHEVKYLWSAAEWLAGVSDLNIDTNRNTYISSDQQRYIFTWNDIDNDGAVDPGAGLNTAELISFETSTDWSAFAGYAGGRDVVALDFGVDPGIVADVDDEVDAIVSWIRGKDAVGYRSREVSKPDNFDVTASAENTITWRLGDVVHSTPTSVARPAENYHMMYRDDTYVDFVNQYKDRRHVIYFGGNDGMIHAVNGGFYNDEANGFCVTPDCGAGAGAPALGAELWAYVPYNLQPQLKCLMGEDYLHRYYVDLKPRIFDVQIFTPDADHPNGWGTIMVLGMRLGGSSVDAEVGDARTFVSAYVIFDITNPEEPPELLGELTYDVGTSAHMGYTTGIPAVVPMKEGVVTKWYLVLGSGPVWLDAVGNWVSNVAVEGRSNQYAKVAVFPLDELTTGSGVFRIPDEVPTIANDYAGRFELPDTGFVSDPITVDFDLDSDYRGDAVYFGTVEGDWGNWSGKFYRMVTNADNIMEDPDDWTPPTVMLNPGRPVTAAPMVGWDGENFWIYFGTGRFFDKKDKSDVSSNAQESYYGIKEPIDCVTNDFTWDTIDPADLVPVGPILVTEAAEMVNATLGCIGGGVACIPAGVTNYEELVTYIAGEGCDDTNQPTGEAGWVLAFDEDRERNLGQATLLGGLLTFTTYQPFDDVCRPEGEAYLYAVYYKTGTAWHEAVFGGALGTQGDPPEVISEVSIGRGLATTPNLHVGREEGTKAFAQTSTGAIVEIEQPNLPIKTAKTGRMSWRVD